MSNTLRPHTGDYDAWCDTTRPHTLNLVEWSELIALPEVREAWGLDDEVTAESFSEQVYAAKFHFHSGSPGYVGDLYILQGDVLTGDPPMMLTRNRSGKLEVS